MCNFEHATLGYSSIQTVLPSSRLVVPTLAGSFSRVAYDP